MYILMMYVTFYIVGVQGVDSLRSLFNSYCGDFEYLWAVYFCSWNLKYLGSKLSYWNLDTSATNLVCGNASSTLSHIY